jgi:hypothetical protein
VLEKLRANKSIIASATIALACILLAMYFLDSSNFSMDAFLLFDVFALKELLFSAEFWLFVLFFSIANGLFLFIFTRFDRMTAIISSVLAASLAFMFSFALFDIIKMLAVVLAFYLIGLVIAEELVKMRLAELKRFRTLRAASAGMSKVVALTCIGLFVAGMLVVMPQQDSYADKFDRVFVKTLLKMGASTAADAVVANQRYLMKTILESEQFMAIRSSSSEIDQNFALYLGTLANKIFSKKYREQAVEQVEKTLGDEEFLKNVTGKLPFHGLMRNTLFILLPLNGALIFWIFGQIVIKNVSAIIAALIAKTQRA